ncbi:MAG TPA: 3-hydroxyacyl-[acyl-carrier-protein] dehydratase FabZ [Erysipelotrichaceae bacterium]|nr:3-hydroxyacyl-[acyl-carrier-protein] dehydratase FabZ [Erysipelotrichaceae bacterium]
MMDIKQIMEIIPHRPPFLLVDRVLELKEGEYAIGLKNVTMNEPYFVGHFPGEPVMPGVLILEALAQVGAIAVLSLPEMKGKIAYFAGVKEAKFRRKVVPGDTLRLECRMTNLRSRYGVAEAKAYVGDDLVCEATLSFGL